MIASGEAGWSDYTLQAELEPEEAHGRCGIVFRYHNNRCYLFWGFLFPPLGGARLVLLRVRHEKEVHVPDETELASAPVAWRSSSSSAFSSALTSPAPIIDETARFTARVYALPARSCSTRV